MDSCTAGEVETALVGLVDRQERVLLARTLSRSAVWQPIGGHVERYDESPATSGAREVWEETGIRIAPAQLKPMGTWPKDTGEGSIKFFQMDVEETRITPEASEIAELRWVHLDAALGLPVLSATGAFLRTLASSRRAA